MSKKDEVKPPRRSGFELKMSIMQALLSGEDRSLQVMYVAHLSYQTFKAGAEQLMAKGLVEVARVGGHRSYALTPKGIKALSNYTVARQMVEGPLEWKPDKSMMVPGKVVP